MMKLLHCETTRASLPLRSVLAKMVALLVLTTAFGAMPILADGATIVRSVEWLRGGDDVPIQGLYAVQQRASGMTMRLLVEVEGERFVLTKVVDPLRGVETTTIRDDGSGWSATSTLDFRFTGATLSEFFSRANELLVRGTPHRVRAALAVDGDSSESLEAVRVEAEASGDSSPSELAQALVEKVLSQPGGRAAWAAAVPLKLHPGLGFLEASMSPEPLPALEPDDNLAHGLRLPVESLAELVARDDLAESEMPDLLPLRVGKMHQGAGLVDRQLLEFAARFASVETADPLRDRPRPKR